MVDLSRGVCVSPQVISQKVGGETVILDMESEQYFGLDEIGSRVWELMQGEDGLEAVTQVILSEFEVGPEQLSTDLESLLEQLLAASLIQLEPV